MHDSHEDHNLNLCVHYGDDSHNYNIHHSDLLMMMLARLNGLYFLNNLLTNHLVLYLNCMMMMLKLLLVVIQH
jgi:hypothetical protein